MAVRVVDTRDLAGPAELRAEHGVSGKTLNEWKKARTFPKPIRRLAAVDVYDRVEVSAWVRDRKYGRHLHAIRELRRTGVVRQAARAVGVAPETVRRWCRLHGEPLPQDPWPEHIPRP